MCQASLYWIVEWAFLKWKIRRKKQQKRMVMCQVPAHLAQLDSVLLSGFLLLPSPLSLIVKLLKCFFSPSTLNHSLISLSLHHSSSCLASCPIISSPLHLFSFSIMNSVIINSAYSLMPLYTFWPSYIYTCNEGQ